MIESKSRISPALNLVDESLDAKLASSYHLSLVAGLDSLSACVLDTRRNKYLAINTWTFQGVYTWPALSEAFDSIVSKNKLLQSTFKSVSAAVVNNRSTLVPNALFDAGSKEKYLSFNHSTEAGEAIMADDLKSIEAKNVYAMSSALEKTLRAQYGNVKMLHHSTTLLESLMLQYKLQNARKVIVHVQLSHFEVVVLEGKNLLLYNSFAHQTSEDFIYYLLFVCEQMKLNPEQLELVLLGEIERNSAIYTILHKYIRNIRFGERTDSFEYSYKLDEIPKHFYYNLFNQYLCIS